MIYWIITALILIALEILTQMVWTLCLAIGCVAAIAGDLCGLDLAWQISLAGVTAVIAYFVLMPHLRKWQHRSEKRDGRDARTGMDALLGRKGVVTEPVAPGGQGRVRIDGDSWQAKAEDPALRIERGSTVTVQSYDSIVLTVTEDSKSTKQ